MPSSCSSQCETISVPSTGSSGFRAVIVVLWIAGASQIGHQTHEAFVLVILVVAMEQRRPGIIGDEIDLDRTEARHVDRILHHARGRLVAHLGDLEGMTMQMDGVVVAALVGHG